MTQDELLALLTRSRRVFERHLFDGETMRDDIAETCIAIDDVLSREPPVRKNSRVIAEAIAE
jgi:hypothetical protein